MAIMEQQTRNHTDLRVPEQVRDLAWKNESGWEPSSLFHINSLVGGLIIYQSQLSVRLDGAQPVSIIAKNPGMLRSWQAQPLRIRME